MSEQESTELKGYARALAAAEELRDVHRSHELLRLVKKGESADMERWDQERLERFYTPPTPVLDHDLTPQFRMDEISFEALADAMERAIQPAPTIKVERIRVMLDPAVEILSIQLDQIHPTGAWTTAVTSLEHLSVFMQGAQAVAGCLGLRLASPDLPSKIRFTKAHLEEAGANQTEAA